MSLQSEIIGIAVFTVCVIVMLLIDMLVFNREAHRISFREALGWTIFWVVVGLLFGVGVWYFLGRRVAIEYFTGYLIEKSLSVDNIFVFIVLFKFFKVDPKYHQKILFWGVLGAIIFRAIMIFLGVALVNKFSWLFYVFGIILIYSAIKLVIRKEEDIHPEKSFVIRLANKMLPIKDDDSGRFFYREDRLYFTHLFIVLLAIETTDIVFAVDSIPAVFAITTDPFVVYTSNILAILGLRALYFVLHNFMVRFKYLDMGLSVILAFVGIKMLIKDFAHIKVEWSLGFIFIVLALSVILSVISDKRKSGQSI
ncbi:MAG: TerC family protein [Deltaproteobacteria bacterium]|nr:TerC family protein [Deltaproteobacteria bacterium]